MKSFQIFLVVTYFVALSFIEARIKIPELDVTVDSNYVKHDLRKEDRDGKTYISSDSEVLQDIDGEIMIHGNISLLHNGQKEPITRILPIDLCKYLSGEKKSIVLKIAWDQLTKFGTLPMACPVKKGLYNIKDFTPDASLIPAALPGGDYHVEVMAELIQGGKTVSTLLSAKVHATVDG